jgi:hypothetical protein
MPRTPQDRSISPFQLAWKDTILQRELCADAADQYGFAIQAHAPSQVIHSFESGAVRSQDVLDSKGFQLVCGPVQLGVCLAKEMNSTDYTEDSLAFKLACGLSEDIYDSCMTTTGYHDQTAGSVQHE